MSININNNPCRQEALLCLETIEKDLLIANSDPLEIGEIIAVQLPNYNNSNSLPDIMKLSKTVCLKLQKLENPSLIEAQAITRDLGLISASLTKAGAKVSDLEPLFNSLINMSKVTNEVPRDTAFSYGPRNPNGHLLRTFTSSKEEKEFINSFRIGMQSLTKAIVNLDAANYSNIENKIFSNSLENTIFYCKMMITSIIQVIRTVTPEYFTRELRPYFEPMIIGNKKYYAPGGAQMQLLLVDWFLWGKSETSITYKKYFNENLFYLPPEFRKLSLSGHPDSLIQTAIMAVDGNIKSRYATTRSISRIKDLLMTILKFRHPHLKLARDNFNLRQADVVGSGGYNIDLLSELIEINQYWLDRMNKLLSQISKKIY